MKMKHEYKTRDKRQESLYQEDVISQLQENNINNIKLNINASRVEIINLKGIIIKRLQDENQKLQVKYSKLEERITAAKSVVHSLIQHERRNNITFTGILKPVQEEQLNSMRHHFVQILVSQ